MFNRLLVGLVKGTVLGGLVAALLVAGLGITSFAGLLGYLAAVGTGAFIGLVAGKPIWRPGAKVEAGLKSMVGGGVAAVVLLLLRKWLGVDVDLSAYGLGHGSIGDLPVVALPAIGAGIAAFFEIDNTDAMATDVQDGKKARIASEKQRVQADGAASAEAEAEAETESDGASAKKARR